MKSIKKCKLGSYFFKKILSEKKNIWKTLYLFRKVYLTKYFRSYFSQFGEDVILRDWLKKELKNGFYVDVGCYHPRKFSNTYFLYKRGWRGINIDLDLLKIATFEMLRPEDCNVHAAVSDVEQTVKVLSDSLYSLETAINAATTKTQTIPIETPFSREIQSSTLNNIIGKTRYAKQKIDLLSIDTEGHDYQVLLSLDIDLYKPKIIIIESHLRDFEKILTSKIYLYLISKGYKLANWVGFSLFFVDPNNDILKFKIV